MASILVDALNLKLPDYYINRELSLLAFNLRVLTQAKDPSVPLLERLKFLCISSTNLDEFFEIRVSGLKHRLAVNAAAAGPDNLSSSDALRTIAEETNALVIEQYRVLNDELIPQLREAGITVSTLHAVGVSGATILARARELSADYIVIGSHGHGAFYDLIVGSTTSWVLKEATCPVLVIPRGVTTNYQAASLDLEPAEAVGA